MRNWSFIRFPNYILPLLVFILPNCIEATILTATAYGLHMSWDSDPCRFYCSLSAIYFASYTEEVGHAHMSAYILYWKFNQAFTKVFTNTIRECTSSLVYSTSQPHSTPLLQARKSLLKSMGIACVSIYWVESMCNAIGTSYVHVFKHNNCRRKQCAC